MDEDRVIAHGGWRRGVVGVVLGVLFGLLVRAVVGAPTPEAD